MMKLSNEDLGVIREALASVERVSPFQRIKAPQHLLDRYNSEISKDGAVMTEMAFTVARGSVLTDEELWNFMLFKPKSKSLDFGDLCLKQHNPPHTGREKTTL